MSGLFALLRGIDTAQALVVGKAAVDAGFEMIEVTSNSPEPWQTLSSLAERFGEVVIVGAGTVLNCEQVRKVADCGGELVVSPNANSAVIRLSKQLGLLSVPGCITPTEVFSALDAGADAIKLFPSMICSPEYLAAIRAVMPKDVPVFVTGGVSAANMGAYLKAGANGFGVGSSLCKAGKSKQDVISDAKGLVDAFRALV